MTKIRYFGESRCNRCNKKTLVLRMVERFLKFVTLVTLKKTIYIYTMLRA